MEVKNQNSIYGAKIFNYDYFDKSFQNLKFSENYSELKNWLSFFFYIYLIFLMYKLKFEF